jgi:hypothetical protein
MLAVTGVVLILLMTIRMPALLVMVAMLIILNHDNLGRSNWHGNCRLNYRSSIGFAHRLANCGACCTTHACADNRTGLAAHRLSHRGTCSAAYRTAYDRAGLAFALRSYGRAYAATHRTSHNCAGFTANRLTDGSARRGTHATTDRRLDGAIFGHCRSGYQKNQNKKRKSHRYLTNYC